MVTLPSTEIASECLSWLACLFAALLRGFGVRPPAPRQSVAAGYSSLVHRVHTPILMVGLVALLGVWHDPAHMAVALAAAFGMTCLFILQHLFDGEPRPVQIIHPRHALVAQCRATESDSPAPVEWRCAMSRSGGAPPPAPAFSRLVNSQDASPAMSTPGARGVLFVGFPILLFQEVFDVSFSFTHVVCCF